MARMKSDARNLRRVVEEGREGHPNFRRGNVLVLSEAGVASSSDVVDELDASESKFGGCRWDGRGKVGWKVETVSIYIPRKMKWEVKM